MLKKMERVFACFEALEVRAMESSTTRINRINVTSHPRLHSLTDENLNATQYQSTKAPRLATSAGCSHIGTPISICVSAPQHLDSDSWGKRLPKPGNLGGSLKDKNSSLESRDSTLSDDSFITSPDADLNGTVKSTPSTLNGLAQMPKKQKPSMPTSSSALSGLWATGVGSKFCGNKTQNQICAIEREKNKNENGSGTTARKKTPVLVISDACISYSKDYIWCIWVEVIYPISCL